MKKTFFLLSSFLLLICLYSCGQSQKDRSTLVKIKELTPLVFKEKSSDQLVLDVRSPDEFAEGHLPRAINMNVRDENFLKNVQGFDKSRAIFVYCKSGFRSHVAATKLLELGFENVYDLEGGILNWIKNDYTIVLKNGQ